jgi:hypothetical protein
MASKRSLLDERTMLWKEYMSRVAIGVNILGSNSPIENITMSTTGSMSKEVEDKMRGSVSSVVENVGYVTT